VRAKVLVAGPLQRKTLMLVIALLLLQPMLMVVLTTVLFAEAPTGMVQRMTLMTVLKR
jgi:hypothetical protein